MRLNDEIESRVVKQMNQLNVKEIDHERTISFPLRRSDKCKGHSIKGSARGETACEPVTFNYTVYIM